MSLNFNTTIINETSTQPSAGIYVYDDMTLYFGPGSKIVSPDASSGSKDNNNLFMFKFSDHINICGLHIDGPVYKGSTLTSNKIADGTAPLRIDASTDIHMYDLQIENSTADGILFFTTYDKTSNALLPQKNPVNRNISIDNAYISHSGRNGISICTGTDIDIKNISISRTGASKTLYCASVQGTPNIGYPYAGIDIEPDESRWYFHRIGTINVENYLSVNNRGAAFGYLGISNLDQAFLLNPPYPVDAISPKPPPTLHMTVKNMTDIRCDEQIIEQANCSATTTTSNYWSYGASITAEILPSGSNIQNLQVKGSLKYENPRFFRYENIPSQGASYYYWYTYSPNNTCSTSKFKVEVENPAFYETATNSLAQNNNGIIATTGIPDYINSSGVTDGSYIKVLTSTAPPGQAFDAHAICNCSDPKRVSSTPNLKYHIGAIAASTLLSLYGSGGTTISNQSFYLDGMLSIDENITFNSCIFLMQPGSSISVLPGTISNNHTLTLTNCTLQSACDEMWDGIYAEDPTAEITLENCTIQDMENGVVLKQGAKAGITNSEFKNCNRSIAIFENNAITNCSITGNTFTADANMLAPYANLKPEHGIYVYNSASLQIGDIGAPTDGNVFENLQNGIKILNETVMITIGQGPNQQMQLIPAPSSYIQLKNNTMSGITRNNGSSVPEAGVGVYAEANSLFGGRPRLLITNSTSPSALTSPTFQNCEQAVSLIQASADVFNQHIDHCGIGIGAIKCDGEKYNLSSNFLNQTYWNIVKTGDESTLGFLVNNNTITMPEDEPTLIGLPPIGILSAYSSKIHQGHSQINTNGIRISEGQAGIGIFFKQWQG